jgi:hypothetical protein
MRHLNSMHLSQVSQRAARAVALPVGVRVQLPEWHAWYVLVAALDVVVTACVLALGGVEANPLADWILTHAGIPGLVVLKFASVALVVSVCEFIAVRKLGVARSLAMASVCITCVPVVIGLTHLARLGA